MKPTGQPTECCTITGHDRQLCHAAIAALHGSRYVALHRLSCSVVRGSVEISGTVPNFYMKQMAQVAVMQLDGTDSVQNLIEVCERLPEPDSPSVR